MNPEDLTPEQFQALSDAERMALMMGAAPADPAAQDPPPPVPEGQVPAEQGVSVPQPEPAAPATTDVGQDPSPDRGDLNVALSQERQRARMAEQRATQMEAMLQDPNALATLLAQLGGQVPQPQPAPEAPALQYEDQGAIEAIVAQHLAPLQQQLAQLTQANQQLTHERQMAEMKTRHPDLDTIVSEFDAARPDLAHLYNPEEKKFLLLGAKAADPAWLAQQVEAEAQKRAEALVAEKLGGLTGNAPKPVTLSGVTPSQRNDAPPDLAALDRGQWASLSDAQRQHLLGG